MEDTYFDTIESNGLRILGFTLLQGIPYFVVCLFVVLCTNQKQFIKEKRFWLISLLGFLVLGMDRGSHFHSDIAEHFTNAYTAPYIRRILSNLSSLILVVMPFYLIYKFLLKNELSHFYGIRREKVDLKPYGVMLLIMIPLIYAASFQEDFLAVYPTYDRAYPSLIIQKYGISNWWLMTIYEATYAFGFFIVELIFRGYFIFALVKYMGKEVVLPMAVTYCVLHFGKPLGEAISSYFGGYLLGVIALKTENIYGGILVHIGIALLMELFAFMQYL